MAPVFAFTLFIRNLAHSRAESRLRWGHPPLPPKEEDLASSSWKPGTAGSVSSSARLACWGTVLQTLLPVPWAPLGLGDPEGEAHPLAFLLYKWCQLVLE